MAMKYTREQLEAMGMDRKQVEAVLVTCAADSGDENNGVSGQRYSDEDGIGAVIAGVPNDRQAKLREVHPVNYGDVMRITTVADLQSYASGIVVRFPDFAEGQPFVARVRRPSMLVLAKQGKIPNGLLAAAGELFTKGGGGMDADNQDMLVQVYDICKIICSAALVEPTMDEIEAAGVELSDDQMMAIFNYTQNGIKALEPFRKE